MIKNTQQENLTKDKIAELMQHKNSILADNTMSDIEKLYSSQSFDAMISSLNEELEEYECLKTGNLKLLEAKSLEELPNLIIKARIVQHMSQTELAKKIGIQAQQIQRYEANDYQNISFDRLIEIAKAVGVCIEFEKTVIVGSGPKFSIPNNIIEADIVTAEEMIKQKGSLIS